MTKELDSLAAIGRRFKQFRRLFVFSAAELAGKLGMPKSYIEAVETGKRAPGIPDLVYLRENLAGNINWILTGDGSVFEWERYEVGAPPEQVEEYLKRKGIPYDKEKYEELVRLMQVREVWMVITAQKTMALKMFAPQIRETIMKKTGS
ncbi:MAG: helix-turn-helix transcriptional regulator [bacterium]|nr:helix-turn-helix transcriptional regulator [bacterium]